METDVINKKCPKCGHISPSSHKFCPECGQVFIKGKINPDTQPISRFPIITVTLLIGLFLALGGLVLWYMFIYPPPPFLQNVVGLVMPSQTPTIPTPTITLTATDIPPTPTATNTPEPTATITLTPTQPPFPPAEAKAKETWVSPVDGMTLVYIPKDLYLIGSLDTDTQAWINEKPQHPVNLSGFWMDKTEVTNAMYAKCVLAGVCPEKKKAMSYTRESYYGNPEFGDFPVIFVSWNDAQTYCAWAGRKLPTEAQWEAAARGPDGKKYPWGNANPNCNLLNFATRIDMKGGKSSLCTGDTTAVGKYPKGASPFGLLDMAGNVWEWVADWNSPNYVVEPRQDPTGPAEGESRIIRGGYFFTDSKYVRAAMRSWHEPGFTSNDLGFRCAR